MWSKVLNPYLGNEQDKDDPKVIQNTDVNRNFNPQVSGMTTPNGLMCLFMMLLT
jgi:hypothetical protein